MKKLCLVINGRGGVGKDTLCDFAAKVYRVKNVSSITPIKEIAQQCGWAGEKTDKARKFLADLKALCVGYNDYPTLWATERYREFLASDEEIMFLHVREPEEIRKFVEATGGNARTLLILGGTRARATEYGNAADDNVEKYDYDYYFTNDLPLPEAEPAFLAFLAEALKN